MAIRVGIDARRLDEGGIGRYVEELLAHLPRLLPRRPRPIDLVVLTTPARVDRVAALAPGAEVIPVRSGGYSIAEHFEIGRVARASRLDLLHLPHYVVPRGISCPIVVTVHDLIHLRLPRTPLHALYCRGMLAAVRRQARVVLVPSEAVAADLAATAGIAPERIRTIPHGVTSALLAAAAATPDPEAEIAALRASRGLSGHYALNVTNGLPHKGIEVLLTAVRDLPDLQLVFAGQGSDGARVRRLVREAGLGEGRVVLLGGLSEHELYLAYRGAAVVVVSSRLEGFGMPALEAMAVGAPVVAASAGGVAEVVGDAGILVPPGMVAPLRESLYRVAFDSEGTERQGLIRRGLDRSRRFSWEDAASRTLAAYELALAGDG